MVVYTSGIWLDVTVGLFAVILYMLYLRLSYFTRKEVVFLAAAAIAGVALFIYEQTDPYLILALELGIFTFNGLLNGKSAKWRTYYVSMSVLYITLLHWIGFVLLAQAMLLGLLSSITNIKEHKNSIENKRVEINRDIVHIAMGIVLIAIFYFEIVPVAVSILMILILGGILAICVGELYKDSVLPSIMYKLERNGANLGHGALWLALGALLAVSFLDTTNVLMVFSAIFIADPVATIVGIYRGGRRLPHNSKKSIGGTVAYFLTTALISSLFVGVYAIAIGAVAAVVESLKLKIDDNFSVSLVLVVLILVLGI
jgi:dolichol kinase